VPTVAELQIVLQAQDNASAQLRRLSGDVQRLHQQVEGVQRSTARGGGFLGGLNIGAGIAAAQGALQAFGGIVNFVKESVIDLNAQLQTTQASYEGLTRNADAAAALLQIVREEAGKGFDLSKLQAAGRQLISFSEGSTERFRDLLQLVEQLAAADPTQGLESAGFAIREALSGDFQSLIDRFEVSRVAINRWREEGADNLEIVRRAIESVGGSAEAVERLGRTFQSRLTVLQSFGNELRQLVGAGLFDRLNDLLGRATSLIAEYGDRLREVASAIGAVLAGIAERVATLVSGPLRALFEFFAPGLWDQLAAGMARVPEALEQTGRTAERAAPVVRDITRDLARAGLAAAELQLEADRVRRRYDEQLEPLERQLRLLQQSADVQRVQNALATNRATVEGIRLDRQIAALQRAARGTTDPNAPGLTLRQRMIALALQEAELRREELGLTEQQRPAVQAVQEQIAALQEAQRRELEPLERKLELQRDTIAALQIERQRREEATADAVAGVQRVRDAWTAAGSPEALADAKKRGEELAGSWLQGWEAWVEENGGDVWKAIGKSLDNWWTTNGRPQAIRIGADLGVAIGAAAGVALRAVFGAELERLQAVQAFLDDMDRRLDAFRAGREGAGEAVPGLDPTVRARSGLPPLVTAPGAAQPGPAQVSPTVNVSVQGGVSAEELRRAREETIKAVTEAFAEAAAATDPGASATLQGARRTP
jgi:hypothetical protein